MSRLSQRERKHWHRWLTLPSNILCILLAAAFLTGCGKEKPKKDYVARVNDVYLTSEELSGMISSGSYSKLYKEELIRAWIKREVLYQSALNDGLTNDEEFKRLVDNSKKELASAFLLKKYFEEESIDFDQKDVDEYFDKHKNEFQLFYDSYLINFISIKDEDKAVSFRLMAIESDWDKALNVFQTDSAIVKVNSRHLLYEHDIHPALLLRMVKELYPQEISIVLSTEPENYSVVQLVEKFEKGTIPPFEIIKDRVLKMFAAHKKEAVLKEYLNELYSDFEIEVKTGDK